MKGREDSDARIEALVIEVRRLRRALDRIAQSSSEVDAAIAQEALAK